MTESLQPGTAVTVKYKSGRYHGEIVQTEPKKNTAVVKITAVIDHPVQGDLHHPKQTNVPLFHERKALSKNEKANVPLNVIKRFDGEVPDYAASLKEAVEKQRRELQSLETDWSNKALETLRTVEQDYRYDQ
ncbi:sporulation phosphorelay system protein KapB [Salisediminibacterium halotolerans]|uniref:Kinase-associated protein B n=1 Tax=Salisediminibacterium halotolerans TaxID=517425 RepID=A0A1H9PZU1_9BACI|nr:sporulation phosphorelay system protein KapB [Salisediminibacterium haloalkalitolerans]SER53727.1 kinase-associated protein B [Salisediminibacterium haloalkalitolerans]